MKRRSTHTTSSISKQLLTAQKGAAAMSKFGIPEIQISSEIIRRRTRREKLRKMKTSTLPERPAFFNSGYKSRIPTRRTVSIAQLTNRTERSLRANTTQKVIEMERWQNRVAVVTGASSGIGAAIVKYLANNGMVTVGLARRKERIEALRDEVKNEAKQRIHAIKCDIRDEADVIAAFKEIESKYGPVAVLVNNAGIVRYGDMLKEGNSQDIRDVIDTNVFGVVWSTREAFRSMKAQGADGHVFLINSVAGHIIPNIPDASLNIYPPSKHAVTAMTEIYRQEFLKNNTKIKITSISPGAVKTEIMGENPPDIPDLVFLASEDIADALIYCLQTPPHVQIHELTIKPVGEKF